MQAAFKKIIEKLEEEKMSYFLTIANTGDEKLDYAYEKVGNALDKAIEIVKQEAEQYNVMIDGEYCFQSCGCTEMCGKCSRIANGDTDYYESICAFSEQTNADRIRSFSDEELAEFIEQVSTDSMETISFGTKEYEEIWEHKETALQWLQSEVEE